MISGVKKLRRSKRILEKILSKYIENLIFEPKLSRIQIKLRDEIKLFVQYNDFNEYAYSIIFSTIELDRCRFDNYDDKWNVSTRPHHFHPRNNKMGFVSPMKGNPRHDIPLFYKLILSGQLFSQEFRFIL